MKPLAESLLGFLEHCCVCLKEFYVIRCYKNNLLKFVVVGNDGLEVLMKLIS